MIDFNHLSIIQKNSVQRIYNRWSYCVKKEEFKFHLYNWGNKKEICTKKSEGINTE